MKTTRLGTLAMALNATLAAHADFSWELAAGIGEADREAETTQFDSRFEALTATHYFDPSRSNRAHARSPHSSTPRAASR